MKFNYDIVGNHIRFALTGAGNRAEPNSPNVIGVQQDRTNEDSEIIYESTSDTDES